MRVLLTIHHELDEHTGAPGVTVQLASALECLGHETEILSWSDLPASLGARGREALFPAFASAHIRRAAHEHVDVVDASTCDAWPWLAVREALRAPRRGPAIVTRTHGLEHTFRDARVAAARAGGEPIPLLERAYHGSWRLREAELTLRLGDAALFLNGADRDRAVRDLGVRPERAHVVANGIPDAFACLPAPSPRPQGTPLRLVQLGSWDARKGVEVTVAALAPLLAEHRDLELALLGTGATPPGAIRAVFPAGVGDRIAIVPRFARAQLPEMLAGHDVLVQPSLAEGFSLALVEAMACGLAPVASRVGAASDVLGEEEAGLLVASGDATALRAAVARLHSDRALVDRLRMAAHAKAQGYRWSRVAAGTAALYEQVVAGRRG